MLTAIKEEQPKCATYTQFYKGITNNAIKLAWVQLMYRQMIEMTSDAPTKH